MSYITTADNIRQEITEKAQTFFLDNFRTIENAILKGEDKKLLILIESAMLIGSLIGIQKELENQICEPEQPEQKSGLNIPL